MKPSNTTESSAQPLERLAAALRAQGVSVESGEESCQVEGEVGPRHVAGLLLRCRLLEERERAPGDLLANLGFLAMPGSAPDLVIQDTVMGVGPTVEAAIDRAVALWLEGVWPLLRAGFLGAAEPGVNAFSLETMNYEANRLETWQVLAGPLQAVGSQAERLYQQLETSPPVTLLMDEIPPLLEAQPPRPYWLRLFLGRQPDGRVEGEVRVNQQLWDAGLGALHRFDWPALPDYAGFRQVVLLQPSG